MSNLITTYYINHRDELLAFVSSRLGGSSEAEDIVQNVFLRLLISNKMMSEVTLSALVYTIAHRLIIDYYRRRTTFEE
jgi:RNA polymerase sigma-70 factor (ECF subfamily)